MRLAIVCPGQASQHAGMMKLFEGTESGRAILAELGRLTGNAFLTSGSEPASLFENRVAQPATVGATLAAWEALRAKVPPPVVNAGYSVGQLSACVCAGALSVSDCLRLAAARAVMMDDACGTQSQGMAAVSYPGVMPLDAELQRHNLHRAIELGGEKAIIAGLRSDLDRFAARIGPRVRVTMLPITVASHTPLMARAAAAFRAGLENAPFVAPVSPLLSGADGATLSDASAIRHALADQISTGLNWAACMDALVAARVDCVLELGPGSALAEMFRSRHPGVPCRSVADFRSTDGVLGWIERQTR